VLRQYSSSPKNRLEDNKIAKYVCFAAIHDLAEANGATYLVLELVEGEALTDRIARGPIPLEQALDIAKQIAEALETAHERGIIHRDLKPGLPT
jgi:serine/threonine protein kinase